MPHLTTPGGVPRAPDAPSAAVLAGPAGPAGPAVRTEAARPADGTEPAGRTGLGVPGWAHPMLAPVEWAALTRPGVPVRWAVLDVFSGPGSSPAGASSGPGTRPDAYCLAAAARLRASGVRVLGRLALREGTRAFGELVPDAHRFLDWYGVDGFYLDGCPAGRAQLAETSRTVTTLRALCAQQRRYQEGTGATATASAARLSPRLGAGPARALVVLGHGTHPHPGYADLADQLVTFRGSWPEYRWSQAAAWTADHPSERFCHLVHGVPRMHLDEALRVARWQGAGTVWFTDRTDRRGQNPWEALPGYWDELVSRLGPGVSE
ncbi:spherulation-specific family 4 protein [Streptomyces sp. Amel2xB2]|uniref:spherulation-specific family 4 protein n=1 Tax=Streptomyces sp. Amel2xB2 TaxID=1305829 RepID=UPI000DB9AFB7|nr:spherulation-specific family 4 protein [Streptomyces sp. Amel2xB2]RAJ71483.1 spherulation-specific family 4 protein [Streptomyces sp. Amel2xB2]